MMKKKTSNQAKSGMHCAHGRGKHARPSRRLLRPELLSLLIVALLVASTPSALALSQQDVSSASGDNSPAVAEGAKPSDSTAAFEKSEIVYARLSADGAPKSMHVINRFEVTEGGLIVDVGDYTTVNNLTNETELLRSDDTTVFEADKGVFFYQGDAVQPSLPWNVSFSYMLDGKRIDASELAGATGKLAVHVDTSRNTTVNPVFYDSFMMQITFTLDGNAVSDIVADGATIAVAGQNETITYTVLPGHDATIDLTAQVTDFAMDGVQVAALPYSMVMEMPNTDEMVEGMTDLSSAVTQLSEGTASLAEGVNELTCGARDLSSGAAAFGEGLDTLDRSSTTITWASSNIKNALSSIAVGLENADLNGLSAIGQLPAGLRQIADGLDALQTNSATVQQGYAAALNALDTAISAIPADAIDQSNLENLAALAQVEGTAADQATVAQLTEFYQSARYVRGVYYGDGVSGSKQAFDGADTLLSSLSADAASGGALAVQAAALRTMADSIESSLGSGQLDQLTQLVDGLSQLSVQYEQFHEGLLQYAAGLSALASNYHALESGTSSLYSGTGELAGGATSLANGLYELDASTSTLPETMRQQIGDMMADYDFPEFEPVSFVSEENEGVTAVQFVMTTEAIEKPEVEQVEVPEEPEPTIWDRFLALFQ